MDQPSFGFERLDVYQRAVELLCVAAKLVESLPRGNGSLADQLKRAALSIPLNVAEASGRSTRQDACRHHAIARGSAMECAAILDACRVLGLLDVGLLDEARGLLVRIVQMLTKLSRS
jgi:four helix bundle protein